MIRMLREVELQDVQRIVVEFQDGAFVVIPGDLRKVTAR
jgi:hypothetical protein